MTIWERVAFKRVEFFLWSVAHGSINSFDKLQRRFPYF